MRAHRVAPWLLAPLLLALSTAAAHGGAFERSIDLAGETVIVQIHGAPLVVAMTPLTLEVSLVERETPTVVRAQWTTPEGATLPDKVLAPAGGPLHSAPLVLAYEGTWRLRVSTPEAASEEIEVRAWASDPYFVAAAPELAEQAALVAGRDETISLVVTDAQGAPAPPASDARAHVELWDEARGQLRETRVLALAPTDRGEYAVEPTAFEPGVLSIRVQSATWGLEPDDRPPVDVVVVRPEDADIYAAPQKARETPGAGLMLLVLAIAGAAALSRRR